VNALVNVPIELRLIALFVLGAAVGSALNLAIYRLAWNIRSHSPWTPRLPGDVRWSDRIPIAGWLRWRRRRQEFGAYFWIRPLLVELFTGVAFAGLYWWEIQELALLPGLLKVAGLPPGVWPCPDGWTMDLHLTLASHLILLSLMIVASLIDLDEKFIPDTITIPGTIAGLVLASIVPWSLLPNVVLVTPGLPPTPVVDFLKLPSPNYSNGLIAGGPELRSLAVGLVCYGAWCFAILPRPWRTRRGWKLALAILWMRIVREPYSRMVLLLAVAGSLLIWGVWRQGGPHWAGLLSALIGLAANGGLIWIVRIAGSAALGKEAMGFGDVTLMAMVGTFVGWQPASFIFFIAPVVGVVVGTIYWVVHRKSDIPYGPFLCLATIVLIVRWADIWNWGLPLFEQPWLVPAVMSVCMALMAVLLGGMRLLRRLF
jgi:prepilin signal peptidase PulO-like enzyme (type II secretory pathway)